MRIAITGMSAMCALGQTKDEIWDNFISLNSGVKSNHRFQEKFFSEYNFGAMEEIDPAWSKGDVRNLLFNKLDECLRNAKLNVDEYQNNLAVSLGTSLLGTYEYMKFVESGKTKFDKCFLRADTIKSIYEKYKAQKGVYISNIACASGTSCFEIGLDLLRTGQAKYVICGGIDYLGKLSICGFNALNSLSKEICRPFDSERKGINLGEGGAFFVLEEYNHALDRGVEIYAEVVECLSANEAYHITTSEPGGNEIIKLIQTIFLHTGLSCNDIDYINLHGTGTQNNDAIEKIVLNKIFNSSCKASSTKSLTGHCLGAAGAIEAYLLLLMMINGKVVNTYNSNEDLLGEYKIIDGDLKIKYALSLSYAFSGNIACLLLKNNNMR